MPGRSPNPNTKSVVVLRKPTKRKSAVPRPADQPAVATLPPGATATPATPPRSSPPGASLPLARENTPAPKPPPLPEDPAVVAARRAERIAAIQAVLKQIIERWPQTFSPHPQPVRPLATGIGQVIAAQLSEVSKTLVHQAIAFWQRQRKTLYLQALMVGGPRYDLDGNPQGEVTPEQQERARAELIAWRAYRQVKRHVLSQRSGSDTWRKGRDSHNPQDILPAAE